MKKAYSRISALVVGLSLFPVLMGSEASTLNTSFWDRLQQAYQQTKQQWEAAKQAAHTGYKQAETQLKTTKEKYAPSIQWGYEQAKDVAKKGAQKAHEAYEIGAAAKEFLIKPLAKEAYRAGHKKIFGDKEEEERLQAQEIQHQQDLSRAKRKKQYTAAHQEIRRFFQEKFANSLLIALDDMQKNEGKQPQKNLSDFVKSMGIFNQIAENFQQALEDTQHLNPFATEIISKQNLIFSKNMNEMVSILAKQAQKLLKNDNQFWQVLNTFITKVNNGINEKTNIALAYSKNADPILNQK